VTTVAPHLSGRPATGFAHRFGRFSVVLSLLGLFLAAALTLPSSWFDIVGSGDHASRPTYTDMTPADPVRLAIGGVSGVEVVAPLVSSDVEPRAALHNPPDDAPLVSWWSGSAKAGAPHGQTILTAHAGEAGGALRPIADLAKGDVVELLTKQGSMHYEVASVRTFDPQTMGRVGISLFKQDGGAGRLVLLSAEGWDGATYQRSVVVTADPLGTPAG
jgi:hypothetical protein